MARLTGVYADYHYIGIGDNGGASDEETVKMLEAIVTRAKIELPLRLRNCRRLTADAGARGRWTGARHLVGSRSDV